MSRYVIIAKGYKVCMQTFLVGAEVSIPFVCVDGMVPVGACTA